MQLTLQSWVATPPEPHSLHKGGNNIIAQLLVHNVVSLGCPAASPSASLPANYYIAANM